MKRLINVPLLIAAGAQALFAFYALMPGPWAGWEDGPSRGAMALVMFEPAALAWLMLLIAGLSAVFTDAFDWVPPVGRGRRRLITATATLLVVVTLGVCVVVALGESPAVASRDNDAFNPVLVAIARFGGIFGPFLAVGGLAWLINAPAALRHLAPVRRVALGALALTTLAGGLIGLQMLSEEIAIERTVALRDQKMIDERARENQAALRELSDASPLVDWLRLTDPLQTADIREAAIRRLARRPTLEADLAQSLQSADTLEPDWALRLTALLDFKPSAALEAPLRANFAALRQRIEISRNQAGDGLYDPTYLDRWFGDQLAETLVVTRKMAESAGIDLRDADRQLAQTVAATYPTSKAAKDYPRGITALDRAIDAALMTRNPG